MANCCAVTHLFHSGLFYTLSALLNRVGLVINLVFSRPMPGFTDETSAASVLNVRKSLATCLFIEASSSGNARSPYVGNLCAGNPRRGGALVWSTTLGLTQKDMISQLEDAYSPDDSVSVKFSGFTESLRFAVYTLPMQSNI